MSYDYDICVIGSGAGGAPVAYELAKKSYSVVVLEKGPWYKEKDFTKDELACCRRSVYTPDLRDERHVIEDLDDNGQWTDESTYDSGQDFWNGNCVGGSSNFMSGFFHRLKPVDFRLLSEFGAIKGANIVDWPISYEDLEPYYDKVEKVVGVSGRIIKHKYQEPRTSATFPFPPTMEHQVSRWIDEAAQQIGYNPIPVPRAILPYPALERKGCSYSKYCGSYGCATGAKGSARAALIDHAVSTGNCKIVPHAKVYKLESDNRGRVTGVKYFNEQFEEKTVDARIYVVACQAIETSRLLLTSTGPKHPHGLGNRYNQLGKNLIFSGGGAGSGSLLYEDMDQTMVDSMKIRGPFVNRALHDWYVIENSQFTNRMKGGMVEFLFAHPNAITRANSQKWDDDGNLVWGETLKKKLKTYFTQGRYLSFEVFNDWLPTDNCFVSLDSSVKDKWDTPVAKIRIGYHQHDLVVGEYLAERGENVLRQMGAKDINSSISGSPPPNLVAGGCRFGKDPQTSVLDADCRMHDADNLYVADGSFMPTGGSVPYTWTIYANSFRVADKISSELGKNS